MSHRRTVTLIALAVTTASIVTAGAIAAARDQDRGGDERADGGTDLSVTPIDDAADPASGDGAATTVPAAPTTTTRPPFDGFVDPLSAGEPYGDTVEGVLTFRGNPTRTYYGDGPVPDTPTIRWRFPETGGLCAPARGDPQVRCGTGWTGQPSVFERDGRTWITFGAYDRAVHVLDADTGERIKPDFVTGDHIKGSGTIDPDGYPLLYIGSRDDNLRVLALDRDELVELWRLPASAVSPTLWNDDWDGAPLVVGDFLIAGGENSWIHAVRLNRAYDADGRVSVDPELVWAAPGWDDELLAALPDRTVSIETSVAISGDVAYVANSGGLVTGWDLAPLRSGGDPTRVFRFWTGDDTDASVVVDEDGYLYVGSEFERGLARAREVGQIMKLDPGRPDDPLVWSVDDAATNPAGIWATPAIHRDLVIVPTNGGRVLGLDRETGAQRWSFTLPGPTWQSPVVVDDVLLQGDCAGTLHAYDVSDTTIRPPELWALELGGCIESTPTVWDGRIYVGTRIGAFFAIE
ncbi:MAG: PQQ-binding-like beta-propeller repeat protein [Actinomycetota bacterium]|nr:PQQ-binding-like beta-propeller repeat protein [Actinomycetota bacterium]